MREGFETTIKSIQEAARQQKKEEAKKFLSDSEVKKEYEKYAEDNVNSPLHYTSGEIECIEAIKASMSEEAFRGLLKGNIIKYIWRYEKKAAPLEDLKKAEWYLKKLIGELENGRN